MGKQNICPRMPEFQSLRES